MSPHKLLNRPPNRHNRQGGGHSYKPDAPTPQESVQPDFLAGTTPIDPDEEQAMEDRARSGADEDIANREGLTPEQLADAESTGGSVDATEADENEGQSAGLFSGDNEDDGPKKKKRFSVRQKSAAGITTTVVVGTVLGLFSILQGPGQLLHFGQLLQLFHFTNNESFTNSRTGKFFMHMATRDNPNRRNLGIVGNKAATKYESKLAEAGIKLDFESPTKNGVQTRRIQGMIIDTPNNPKAEAIIKKFRAEGVEIEDLTGGRFRIDLRGDGGTKTSRKVIKVAVESLDLTNIGGSVAKRLLIHRARVDMHPMRNKAYEKGQETKDSYNRKRQKETADVDSNGADPPDGRISGVQEDVDNDGTVDNDTTQGGVDSQAELDLAKEADTPGKFVELKEKWKGFTGSKLVKGAGYVGAAVGVICAAKALGEQAEAIEYARIILPLIRIGVRIVATASQVMTGQGFNIDELGALIDTLHSEEFGSWAEARSIQAENKQKLTGPDIEDDAKPSNVGEKPKVFQVLDNEALDAVCGVNDKIGNLPIIKQIGELSDKAINTALGTVGWSQEQLMSNLASLFAANGLGLPAFGAVLGNYANYGARLAANDAAIGSGGRALNGTEVAQLDAANRELLDNDFAHKSMFARYFDLKEPRSLAARTVYEKEAFYKPRATFANLLRSPVQIFTPMSSMFESKIHAQEVADEEYDYGFPEYGFSLDEQDDERLEDPLANAELIEPRLETLNERYEKCFSMSVKPGAPEDGGGNLINGEAARYDEIADNKDCSEQGEIFEDGTSELLRYRMYLADMVNTHALACYEGISVSCNQLGFGSVVETGTGTVITPGSGKIEGDPYTDSTGVDCAPGTTKLGQEDGYTNGTRFTVQLCSLPNLPSSSMADNPGNTYSTPGANGFAVVNSRVSGAWFALVNDAKAAGISNIQVTSSFRSMQHQTDLFNSNPDPTYVARPGYSSHQAGVALDFASMHTTGGQDCGAGRARSPDDPLWNWLYDNAERYGFKQYAAEAWHWDALPVANRCGAS